MNSTKQTSVSGSKKLFLDVKVQASAHLMGGPVGVEGQAECDHRREGDLDVDAHPGFGACGLRVATPEEGQDQRADLPVRVRSRPNRSLWCWYSIEVNR